MTVEPTFLIMALPTPCSLTVKLRGRAQAPKQSRGCTMSSRTRGDTTESHGPLQRWLEPQPSKESVRSVCTGVVTDVVHRGIKDLLLYEPRRSTSGAVRERLQRLIHHWVY